MLCSNLRKSVSSASSAVWGFMLRVIACTGKVERHVRLAAHDPGIVAGGNIEHLARVQLDNFSIGHSRSGATGQHHSNMFDHAFFLPQAFPYVLRPPPTRLISGPPDRHAADAYQFKLAFLKSANLIGFFEALQNNFLHRFLHGTGTSSRLFFPQALIGLPNTNYQILSTVLPQVMYGNCSGFFLSSKCCRDWLLTSQPKPICAGRSAKAGWNGLMKIKGGLLKLRKHRVCPRVP